MSQSPSPEGGRQRMGRASRAAQLLLTARSIVREKGVSALTLGRLAAEAGVTKPVVYSHFPDRSALLLALYAEYEKHQTLRMEGVIAAAPATLEAVSSAIAETYVDCVLGQGVEIPGVSAALFGVPELAKVKQDYDLAWQMRCQALLAPVSPGSVSAATLLAIQGAADSLSNAAVQGVLPRQEACDELALLIVNATRR